MQRKFIVLAIAGAMAGLTAGSAIAADASSAPSVSFYGVLDYGFLNRGGNGGAVTTEGSSQNALNSGISAGSRLGVKGGKELANGTKFLYEIEYGVTLDNNGGGSNSTSTTPSSPFWNRHSYIGVTGDSGTFVGGRLEGARFSFSNAYDPFAGGTVGNFGSLLGHQARADNAVAYISPSFAGGFSVLAAYTARLTGGELPGDNGDARLYAIAPQYNNGPLSVTYDYEDATVHGTGGDIKINVLGGSYDFTVIKLFAYWESVKASGALAGLNLDQKAYLLGATAPVSEAAKLKVSYGNVKDGYAVNNNCTKASVGVDYSLDKSFNIYSDFASISNQSNASCTIATSSASYSGSHASFAGVDSTIPGNTSGYGTRGFDLGVKYKF